MSLKTQPEVLIVDDSPADIDLTREAMKKSAVKCHINAVCDGVEAISFLRRQGGYAQAPVPDLLLLDLNLPRKDGRQVLKQLKSDPKLSKIPVVVFSTSQAAADIAQSYQLGANSYLHKPGNLADFMEVVQSMAEFWLQFASLPKKEK
jgi:chemotaxis family two-component system response regulator Rcp1